METLKRLVKRHGIAKLYLTAAVALVPVGTTLMYVGSERAFKTGGISLVCLVLFGVYLSSLRRRADTTDMDTGVQFSRSPPEREE